MNIFLSPRSAEGKSDDPFPDLAEIAKNKIDQTLSPEDQLKMLQDLEDKIQI